MRMESHMQSRHEPTKSRRTMSLGEQWLVFYGHSSIPASRQSRWFTEIDLGTSLISASCKHFYVFVRKTNFSRYTDGLTNFMKTETKCTLIIINGRELL